MYVYFIYRTFFVDFCRDVNFSFSCSKRRKDFNFVQLHCVNYTRTEVQSLGRFTEADASCSRGSSELLLVWIKESLLMWFKHNDKDPSWVLHSGAFPVSLGGELGPDCIFSGLETHWNPPEGHLKVFKKRSV